MLAEVLAEVLRAERVSVDSHFFDDLGADSMVMAQFCARVRKQPDLPSVSIKDIYQHPTIRSLAAALAPSGGTAVELAPASIEVATPASTRQYVLCGTLVTLSPLVLFAGSPLYVRYLRALGARVGRGVVVFSRHTPVCTDLLTIGDGTDRVAEVFGVRSAIVPHPITERPHFVTASSLDTSGDLQRDHRRHIQAYQGIHGDRQRDDAVGGTTAHAHRRDGGHPHHSGRGNAEWSAISRAAGSPGSGPPPQAGLAPKRFRALTVVGDLSPENGGSRLRSGCGRRKHAAIDVRSSGRLNR